MRKKVVGAFYTSFGVKMVKIGNLRCAEYLYAVAVKEIKKSRKMQARPAHLYSGDFNFGRIARQIDLLEAV